MSDACVWCLIDLCVFNRVCVCLRVTICFCIHVFGLHILTHATCVRDRGSNAPPLPAECWPQLSFLSFSCCLNCFLFGNLHQSSLCVCTSEAIILPTSKLELEQIIQSLAAPMLPPCNSLSSCVQFTLHSTNVATRFIHIATKCIHCTFMLLPPGEKRDWCNSPSEEGDRSPSHSSSCLWWWWTIRVDCVIHLQSRVMGPPSASQLQNGKPVSKIWQHVRLAHRNLNGPTKF